MFKRILIANRGEIACRVMRTARRLGIRTVAVYSEPDANALHVDSVDVAVALGGSSPGESYLRADAVLAAALDTGCDAVHPGYGFLAENADFARQVTEAGLTWVGPTPEPVQAPPARLEDQKLIVDLAGHVDDGLVGQLARAGAHRLAQRDGSMLGHLPERRQPGLLPSAGESYRRLRWNRLTANHRWWLYLPGWLHCHHPVGKYRR